MIDAFFESHGEAAFVIRPGAEPLLYPFADLRVLVLHPVRERDVRFDPLPRRGRSDVVVRSEEHTSELQSRSDLVCRLLLEKKKKKRSLQNIAQHNFTLLQPRNDTMQRIGLEHLAQYASERHLWSIGLFDAYWRGGSITYT